MSLDHYFRQNSESMKKALKKMVKTTPEGTGVSGELAVASPGMEPNNIQALDNITDKLTKVIDTNVDRKSVV